MDRRGSILLLFTEQTALQFFRVALGIGCTEIAEMSNRQRKSMSTETTFKDCRDPAKLREICNDLCLELAKDLQGENLKGSQVTLKIKTDTFDVKTKVSNLNQATSDASVIYETAVSILRKYMEECKKDKPLTLRLLGVRVSELVDASMTPAKTNDQTSIKSYMNPRHSRSVNLELESIECPLCGVVVEVRNEAAFNTSHFEKCCAKSFEDQPGGSGSLGGGRESSMLSSCKTRDSESCEFGQFPSATTALQELTRESDSKLKKVFFNNPRGKDINNIENTTTTDDLGNCSNSEVTCPICQCKLQASSCDFINTHIDLCLNKQTIGQIVRSSSGVVNQEVSDSAVNAKKRKLSPIPVIVNSKKPNKKVASTSIKSYFTSKT